MSELVYFREHKEANLQNRAGENALALGGNVELHADSFVSPSMYNLKNKLRS